MSYLCAMAPAALKQQTLARPIVCCATLQIHFLYSSSQLATLAISKFLEYGNLFPTQDVSTFCFFLWEALSLPFSCLIIQHTLVQISSSERPFLANPYRNGLPQACTIISLMTLCISTLPLSSFEVLQRFPAG